MKPKLKDLRSLEIEENLSHYYPENPDHFGTWVRLMIGPEGETGSESFDVFVCTPEWVKIECDRRGMLWGRPMLIMARYDYNDLWSFISKHVESFSGTDWQSLAIKLSRIGSWEFEDYQHLADVRS